LGLPLLAASGDEVVRALKRAGFQLTAHTPAHATLQHGFRRLVIRRGDPLAPEELLAILRASGVSYAELIELLDAPRYESSVRRRTLPDGDVVSIPKRRTAH
jgi:predicted RNA binding protein YcfA (HicA-like mRNA interferase family)